MKMKKFLSLVLSLAMMMSLLVATAAAADVESFADVALQGTTATSFEVGDTFDVNISNKDMDVVSFACGIGFNNAVLECTGIEFAGGADTAELVKAAGGKFVATFVTPTADRANETGNVGFAWGAGWEDEVAYVGAKIATVSFKVVAAGDASIQLWQEYSTAAGDVVIDANNNSQYAGKLTITATTPAPIVPVAVTGVDLNKATLNLKVGKSATLVATVNPSNADNKAVVWYSSDESVATVDQNGKVTAKKVGTATITVTTVDGGYTDTCSVTVTKTASSYEPDVESPKTFDAGAVVYIGVTLLAAAGSAVVLKKKD